METLKNMALAYGGVALFYILLGLVMRYAQHWFDVVLPNRKRGE